MTSSSLDLHALLRSRFGLNEFKPGQQEAIAAALNGERLLLIQPTGWGKSLVYQMIAQIMREQKGGLTIVFSPLKALMRDQVMRARQLGLRAELLNSDQGNANDPASQLAVQREILERARAREVDILFIAPERMENDLWNQYLPDLPMVALVVDEAHCISNWGHDFRPEYRRIVNVVRRLRPDVPVVAVTATATAAVEAEILEQLGGGRVMRGPLARQNLRLHVQPIQGDVERFAWVAHWVARLEGTGIVYAATQAQTVELAEFLRSQGISAAHYHGGMKAGRTEVEQQFMSNEIKVVVATNALGMGVDKPDVRFVIHAQFPGSPLSYYQEIGRAGRDGQAADIVLLFDPTDVDIQKHFIQRSKPRKEAYEQVMQKLEQQAYREKELAAAADLDHQIVKRVLTDLMLRHAVARDADKFYRLIKRVSLDELNVDAPYDRRIEELDTMFRYAEDEGCRMRFFTRFLGDPDGSPCGICDRCQPTSAQEIPQTLLQAARVVAEYPLLRIQNVHDKQLIFASGYASDYYAGTTTGELIRRAKYGGGNEFDPKLVAQVVNLIRQRLPLAEIDLITFIPPTKSGDRVQKFASEVARQLGISLIDSLHKVRLTREQKDFSNREAKKQNIHGAIQVKANVSEQNIILIDDVCDNGITLAEAGKMLKKAGAGTLHAVTIAKTRLSDA